MGDFNAKCNHVCNYSNSPFISLSEEKTALTCQREPVVRSTFPPKITRIKYIVGAVDSQLIMVGVSHQSANAAKFIDDTNHVAL